MELKLEIVKLEKRETKAEDDGCCNDGEITIICCEGLVSALLT